MAKKQPKEKKIYTLAEIKTAMEELPKLMSEWNEDEELRNKIGSLYATATRWNKKGGGIQTQINNLMKSIRGLTIINKRTPSKEIEGMIWRMETDLKTLELSKKK